MVLGLQEGLVIEMELQGCKYFKVSNLNVGTWGNRSFTASLFTCDTHAARWPGGRAGQAGKAELLLRLHLGSVLIRTGCVSFSRLGPFKAMSHVILNIDYS